MSLSLLPPDVRLCSARLASGVAPPLLGPEKRSAAHFLPARLHEFAVGRDCARRAMGALNCAPTAIAQADDRSPLWPAGITGSITHSATWCLAAVARISDGYVALGIDVEPLTPLPVDIEDAVLSEAEQAWILKQPVSHRHLLGRLVFSTKECAYKCQYPLSRKLLDFLAMEVRVDWVDRKFTAEFVDDAHPFQRHDVIRGRFDLKNGHFVCAAALRSRKVEAVIEASSSLALTSSPCQSLLEVYP